MRHVKPVCVCAYFDDIDSLCQDHLSVPGSLRDRPSSVVEVGMHLNNPKPGNNGKLHPYAILSGKNIFVAVLTISWEIQSVFSNGGKTLLISFLPNLPRALCFQSSQDILAAMTLKSMWQHFCKNYLRVHDRQVSARDEGHYLGLVDWESLVSSLVLSSCPHFLLV